jgi:O-antigen ligase
LNKKKLEVFSYISSIKNNNFAWQSLQYGILLMPFFTLLSVVALVVAMVFSWQKKINSLIRYRPNQVFGIFIIWLFITCITAFKHKTAWLGTLNFIPLIFFTCSSGIFIQKISQLRTMSWLIVLPSMAIVGLGLGQIFFGWETPSFLYRLDLGWNLTAYGNPQGRMSSIFMYANILGAYLLFVFILGVGLWLDYYMIWRKNFNQKGKILLTILSLAIIADFIGIVFSDSRNAWIIAIACCLAFSIYLGHHWLSIIVTSIAAIVAGASWLPHPLSNYLRVIVPSFLWARLSDELYPDRTLASLRTTQWEFALKMMKEHPIFGWGLRNFSHLYQAQWGEWFGHPHNFFIMLLAEIGIPGTLILCGLISWIYIQSIKILINFNTNKKKQSSEHLIFFSYLIAFASCTLFNLFDVTLFNTKINIFDWIILSAIWGIVYNYSQSSVINQKEKGE